ncbi:MAG: extracellular solute-binding protein [Oscillospiraceae bacterium]|nr:extracellular solute-binding protein [Oscillospiraceae bacterium]
MKKLIIPVLALALSFTLIACDQDDGATGAGADAEVVFFTWWGDGERAMGEALVADFVADNPGVTVQENYIAFGDYLAMINTMVAAGNTPDVFFLPEFLVLEWGMDGVAQDLMPHFQENNIDPNAKWVDAALYYSEGRIFGINPSLTLILLFYNQELFAEHGIAPPPADASTPWSWDEFVAAATVLTRDMDGNTPADAGFNYNNVVQWGTTLPNSWIYVLPLLYTANSSIADDTGTQLRISDPLGVNALQTMADLALVHQVAPTIALTGADAFGDFSVMLMNDQLGMFIGGAFLHPNFANEDFEVGMAQIPSISGDASNMSWGAGYVLGSEESAAFDFLMHLIDFNNSVTAAENHGVALSNLPQVNSIFDDAALNTAWLNMMNPTLARVSGDILQNGTRDSVEPVTLRNFGIIMDQHLVPLFDRIWLGQVSAADGVAEIEATLQGLLEGSW